VIISFTLRIHDCRTFYDFFEIRFQLTHPDLERSRDARTKLLPFYFMVLIAFGVFFPHGQAADPSKDVSPPVTS